MSIVVFCAGLVFGQLVLLIAVHILFLRGPIDIRRNRRRQLRDRVTGRTTQPSIVFAGGQRPAPPDSAVLDYFKYDPSRYQVEGEQCGWLNIGIGQLINVYRYSAEFHTALVRYLDQRMNGQLDQLATKTADGGTGQRLLDFVRVISIDLGSSYPQVLGSRVGYSETGSLRTELQFEWSDQISIAIETQLNVNWPVPLMAALPIQLTVTVVRITGTLAFEFGGAGGGNSSSSSSASTTPALQSSVLLATFMHDFDMQFDIKSLIGHKTKLKDMPKVGELIAAVLRNVVEEEMVWPNFRPFRLPGVSHVNVNVNLTTEASAATSR